jgi:hypothetical protein
MIVSRYPGFVTAELQHFVSISDYRSCSPKQQILVFVNPLTSDVFAFCEAEYNILP